MSVSSLLHILFFSLRLWVITTLITSVTEIGAEPPAQWATWNVLGEVRL